LTLEFTGALFAGNGAKLPKGQDPTISAANAFLIAFQYYWISFLVVLLCSMIFLQLVRKKRRADLFDWLGMTTRSIGCLISLALFGITFKKHDGKPGTVSHTVGNLLLGPGLVPFVVVILFVILSVDQLSRIFCNWRLKRKGLYVEPEEHGHGHEEHSHGHVEHSHTEDHKSPISVAVTEITPAPGYSPVPNYDTGYPPQTHPAHQQY
jgi:hypothetical protein